MEENNKISCTSCYYYYYLNSNKQCVDCPTECSSCIYNELDCLECRYIIYSFIKNEFKCLYNRDPNQKYLLMFRSKLYRK